jgi:methionyl-tRNA synthetase
VIGKDILRFHMIYWPIMLMALGEKLPKKIYAHSWYLMGDGKMSKSKGNIIYADDLVKLYGVYLLSQMPFANDGLITNDLIVEKINADLANNLGNLVNRTLAMNNKYFTNQVNNIGKNDEKDIEFINFVLDTVRIVDDKMNTLHISEALDAIIALSRRCNKYIDEKEPWKLAKEPEAKDQLQTVIYNLLEAIRFIAVLLQPFVPETSIKIFKQLNSDYKSLETISTFGKIQQNYQTQVASPLFMRLETSEDVK